MEDGKERCQEAADYRLQAGREAFRLLGGSDGGSVEAWKRRCRRRRCSWEGGKVRR